MRLHPYFFLAIFFLLPSLLPAQQTLSQERQLGAETSSYDLYGKQKFGAAKNQLELILKTTPIQPVDISEFSFMRATSAARLQHAEADYLVRQFIAEHPESTRVPYAWFQLGNRYFDTHNYRAALNAYEKSSAAELNREELAELALKRGYSHFRQNNYTDALAEFAKVKDQQTKYTGPATYYFAHIMYMQGNYDTALREFDALRNDETFRGIVPFYIIQIYYMQGRYDEMLALAQQYVNSPRNRRTNEILRLAADVSFKQGDFDKAIEYMESYRTGANLNREDSYILGYSYARVNRIPDAVRELQYVTRDNDTLSQYAYYHLGESYLKTKNKQFASNAFLSAWKVPVKSPVAEDALFNYAKLAIELSYDPYAEAVRALQQYLKEYPDSPRRNEAYTYLANLYLVTKNYKEALATLERVPNRTAEQNTIYQKIAYYRGLELVSNNVPMEAISLFRKAIEIDRDREITAYANFWAGESYYRAGQWELAGDYYARAAGSPVARAQFMNELNYNLGYISLKEKNYPQAATYFTNYLQSRPSDSRFATDARLRLGDALFMQRKFAEANRYYEEASARGSEADYALYQRAMIQGVSGKQQQKLADLRDLVSRYPQSAYADDALFEIGQTQMTLQQNQEALGTFNRLISAYPKSSLVIRALLRRGLIYYNTDNENEALASFKQVVKDYPGTPESREALDMIQNIYVGMNRVDEYIAYTNEVPFANVGLAAQDSLLFVAAEGRYMNGDCSSALPSLEGYIQKFPNGMFALKAHYYRADCLERAGRQEDALSSYEFIAKRPRNAYSEEALLKASTILYAKKEYQKALEMYEALETYAETKENRHLSVVGQMRANYMLNNYGIAIQKGQDILNSDGLSPVLAAETQLTIGKSALKLNRMEMARTAFEEAARLSKGELGAEALYLLAESNYQLKSYKQAEDQIFRLTGDYAAYDYWVAKSFILLSDVYVATGNTFQAKQTLQSVIENHKGEELRTLAKQKLEILEKGTPDPNARKSAEDDNIYINEL